MVIEDGSASKTVDDVQKPVTDKIKGMWSKNWHKLSTYGKITTIASIVFVLLCLVAFLCGKTAAGIIAALQIMLIVVALLLKKQVIKTPKTWIHFVVREFAVTLLVPYVSLFVARQDDTERFTWSDIQLADIIPEPESHFGEVIGNSAESLFLYVHRTSTADYSEYVDACKDKGFIVDADQSELSYHAYNADGYSLSLFYNEGENVMDISVDVAKQYGTLVWPDSQIANMLPVPTSTTGDITQDDNKGLQSNVSNTSPDDLYNYAAAFAYTGLVCAVD